MTTKPINTPVAPQVTQQPTKQVQQGFDARVLDCLARSGGPRYDVFAKGTNLYHIKSGHLSTNIILGCCGQCYKFDLDFGVEGRLILRSTVPCNGWWGGAIGAGKESNEKARVASVLANAFPERQVVIG